MRHRIELLKGGVELYEKRAEVKSKASRSLRHSAEARSALHAKTYIFYRKDVYIGSLELKLFYYGGKLENELELVQNLMLQPVYFYYHNYYYCHDNYCHCHYYRFRFHHYYGLDVYKYKYLLAIFLLIILLYGCSLFVTPLAGNFKGDPLDINEAISPQAIELIELAFAGFEDKVLIDSHLHIVGLGAGDTGIWVNPEMLKGWHWVKRFKFAVYKSASGIRNEDNADQEYIERLIKLIDSLHSPGLGLGGMQFFILAFDKHYDKSGNEDLTHTSFYVPNEYIVSLANKYPQFFIPVVSIHPYRKDALLELDKWHKQGIKYIKWLPNAQGIDPSDKDIIPFYKKMAAYNMALITHTGDEKAVEGEAFQRLGNPQLLYLPLQHGVTVIMAHLATLGMCEDLQNIEREVSCFQLAIEMLNDKRYEQKLFADISAITQYNRTDKLEAILDKQSLHHRFINGSDYPLPAINFLYKTSQLEGMGFISEDEQDLLNEIYSYNPLLFDFVLKRTIKSPRKGNKLLRDAFVFPENILQ